MRTSESTNELWAALLAADLENPAKGARTTIQLKQGGSFSYAYADLPTIIETVRPLLAAQGLLLVQEATTLEGRTAITTRLVHVKSDQWAEFGPLVMPHANDPQAVGSAVTYGRRYQSLGALGLAAEDDDGQRARTSDAGRGGPPTSPPASDAAAGGDSTGGSSGSHGEGPPSQPEEAPPVAAPSPLVDQLRRLTGSAAAAREQVNRSNGTDYTARTVVGATDAELKLAIAEWQEEHPSLVSGE